MHIFDNINSLAKKQGKNVKTVALDIGLSENAIYAWKKTKPKAEDLAKVADYFHVSVDYLLGREGDYKFDDYLFYVNVTQNSDGEFNIGYKPLQDTPSSLLQTLREVKNEIEALYNRVPDFNSEDSLWTVNYIEEQFLEKLSKHGVWVTRLKSTTKQPIDLADLVDDNKINWDEWVSFDGKPLTDEVKTAMKLILGKRLED